MKITVINARPLSLRLVRAHAVSPSKRFIILNSNFFGRDKERVYRKKRGTGGTVVSHFFFQNAYCIAPPRGVVTGKKKCDTTAPPSL